MKVFCPNYLRVLEVGNFINFVAMAFNPDEMLALIKTDEIRLKVHKSWILSSVSVQMTIFLMVLRSCWCTGIFILPFIPKQTPAIAITLPESGLRLHQPCTIRAHFKNPLAKRLTNGRFIVLSGGYLQNATVDMQRYIEIVSLHNSCKHIEANKEVRAIYEC